MRPQILLEDRHQRFVVIGIGKVVGHPHQIGEGTARGGQCARDVAERLMGLLRHIVGDGFGLVVETGGTGDMHIMIVNDGPGIADRLLEFGVGGDTAH